MTKPMKYGKLVKLLKASGFIRSRGKGDHEKWTHPALSRPVIITRSREVSPGVTRIALQAIEAAKGPGK